MKQKKFRCEICLKAYTTIPALRRHMQIKGHKKLVLPPPPPPAPKPPVKIERSQGIPYHSTYTGGKDFEVGDVFYRVEKHVVKTITKTLGSNDAVIDSEITKQHYQRTKPE